MHLKADWNTDDKDETKVWYSVFNNDSESKSFYTSYWTVGEMKMLKIKTVDEIKTTVANAMIYMPYPLSNVLTHRQLHKRLLY